MKLAILLVAFVAFIGSALANEPRVALVIGNSAYERQPLRNPVNDAQAMSARLRSLGFVVIERNNLRIRQIGSTLREFRSQLKPGAVALVFYAGHGLQVKGENYLPAVDAQIDGEEDVPNQSLAVRQIMDVLADSGSRLNLVFLDACRNNPYSVSFRSASQGLSRENVPSGTLMSFATRPGGVADDGAGRNGLYTSALLQAMTEVNQPIERVLKSVVTQVRAASNNRQEPWMEGSISGDFCFGGCTPAAAAAPSALQLEEKFWEHSVAIGNREAYEAYLAQYPQGRYAALARAGISRLTAPVAAASLPVPNNPTPQTQRPQAVQASALSALGTVFKDCDECPEMVAIPGGSFLMGSPDGEGATDERPQRRVQVGAFAVGRFEVTQRQWFAVMGTRPSRFTGDDRPVENVSWDDANTYVSRLSQRTGRRYRLPSEAEWEYAARAGSSTPYYFGSDTSRLGSYAWFDSNSSRNTQPVGRLQPNAFGLYDMLGNVWEWVEDCWNGNYSGAPTDGRAWTAGDCGRRVLRSGSWFTPPRFNRVAMRAASDREDRYDVRGFRVARTD